MWFHLTEVRVWVRVKVRVRVVKFTLYSGYLVAVSEYLFRED